MCRRRALWAFGAVGSGIVLAVRLPGADSLSWLLACPPLLALAALAHGRVAALGLWLCAAALGASWGAFRINEWSGAAIPRLLDLRHIDRLTPLLLEVEGELLDTPKPRPQPAGALAAFAPPEPAWVVQVKVDRLWHGRGSQPARDLVRLSGPGDVPSGLRLGQRIRVVGLYSPLAPPMNPGGIDWRRFEAQRARAGSLWISDASLIRITADAPSHLGARARGWVDRLRARASHALPEGTRGAALVRSLLLGERLPDVAEARDAFQRLGLAHVLAISGFHLTVLAGAVLGVLRLTGDRGALEPLLASGVVILYALVVPAEAPIIRSALMVLGIALGRALGRRYDDLNSLAWVAVILLIWRPADLYSLGFQLSFGLTGCLIWLVPRVLARHAPIRGIRQRRTRARRAARRLTQAVVTTCVCWLVSLPALIYAIGAVSPIAVLATLVVAPLALVVMWFGFGVLLIGMILPGAAAPARPVLAFLGDALSGAVLWLDDLPGTLLYLPQTSWLWALGATCLIVLAFALGGRRAVIAGLLALASLLAHSIRPRPPADSARIDVLSLSGGSCTLIRAGDDAVLWDCGGGWPGAGVRDIPRSLRALGAPRGLTLVLSDPAFDHFSAAVDVVAPLGIRRAVISRTILDLARVNPSGPHGTLLARLRAQGVEIDAATTELALGSWRLALARTEGSTPGEVIREERLHARLEGPGGVALVSALPGEARQRLGPGDVVVRTSADGARAGDAEGAWLVIDTFGDGPLTPGPARARTTLEGAASVRIGPGLRRFQTFLSTSDDR